MLQISIGNGSTTGDLDPPDSAGVMTSAAVADGFHVAGAFTPFYKPTAELAVSLSPMRRSARRRGGGRVLGIALLVVAPGLALGYFGLRAQAEREQSLRTNYAATTVLVRDRLEAEIERLEAALPVPVDAAGLSALEKGANAQWLQSPFILGVDGSVVTPRLTAGKFPAPLDPLTTFPAAATAVMEAEHCEFVRRDLECALRLYRHALTQLPKGSAAGMAFIRTRIGRTLFKLQRFAAGIDEYEAAAEEAGDAVDSHGLPFKTIALLQIADGWAALKHADDSAPTRDRVARFVLEHPWDLDNGYRQYVAAVQPANAAVRARKAAIENEIASIDWIRQHLYPRLREELAGKAPPAPAPQQLVVVAERLRLVGYRRIVFGPSDTTAICGYELRTEYLSGTLLAQVLSTVDLGNDLRVSIVEENAPHHDQTRSTRPTAVASVDLFPGVPHWKVMMADSGGRSIAQLVAYERWTYGALVAGMLGVMAVGVALTLRVAARATELARAKTDFVSNVSHELKTPLALIRMYGETLESGIVSDPAKRQEFYGVIRRESERLTHLIDNVLDASRIDRGTKHYEMREHDLVDTVHAALDAYRPLFERAGFAVQTAFPQVPIPVAIDREAIVQSLVNLFQNVIKYSRNERTVSVAIRTGDGTGTVSVTDRGIGIPADQIDRVFEPYYRVPRDDEGAVAGSGLGLAIVKHAVDAHGGRVEVVSVVGEGTSFTIVLPLAGNRSAQVPLPAPKRAVEAG